jgi:fatty-acyl-CoA synthase
MTALPSWLQTISRVGGTITAAPDFVYRLSGRLVDPRTVDLHTLRVATNGGEAVRLSSINTFEERFAVPGVVRPGFGLAEATLGVASTLEGEPIMVDDTGAVCCGAPLRNVRLRIADAEGRDQPAGVRGRILVAGEAVSAGYLNDPESTAAILQDGWLDTGDVGATDAAGRLYVHGRTRAMIKRAGAAIAPREIEELVDELAGVRRSAAVGLDTGPEALTEMVCVVVEIERRVDPAGEAALSGDISSTIRRALGFAPNAIRFVKPGWIPRTATGKTQYSELKSLLRSGLE